MKIDIHSHLFDRGYFDAMQKDMTLEVEKTDSGQTLLRRDGYTYMWWKEPFFDMEHRVRLMDQQGVAMRALSLSSPSVYDFKGDRQVELARHCNDVTAKIVASWPGRFIGLGTLPLCDIDASLSELDRLTGELGIKGLMIGSNVAGHQMNDPRFEPVWARINQLRIPVFEHPMFPPGIGQEEFELPLRLGFVFDTTTCATRMIYSGIFERYPDFPYIMAHTGGALLTLLQRLDNGYQLFPDCRKYIDKPPSEYAKRLYYDTASFYAPSIMMAHGIVGADHLLWGSDEPMIGADTRLIDGLPISQADKDLIVGGNAARLFGLA